jgi:sterol desaturase/sphingolipid hydroxylase (fatty acid hydroxylase superfamily)
MYFLGINLIFAGLGTIDSFLYTRYTYMLFMTILFKNYVIPLALFRFTREQPYLLEAPRDTNAMVHLGNILSTSTLEFGGVLYLIQTLPKTTSIPYEILLFIPNTFLLEIIFDFFHYTSHRILHSIPHLYINIHKSHHQDIAITVMTTFQHSTLDLILSNAVPLLLTCRLHPIPQWSFFVWLWYKSLIEMGGHSGKSGKSSSFPQCVWIPRVFGIELYSQDHHMHHVYPNVNFSKRFSLWDKVFGTFRNGPTS